MRVVAATDVASCYKLTSNKWPLNWTSDRRFHQYTTIIVTIINSTIYKVQNKNNTLLSLTNKSIVDGRLRLGATFWRTRPNAVVVWRPTSTATWWTSSKHNVVHGACLFAPWYENMTLSIKPEVRNLSQRRQRRTEPRPQETCRKNLVKFSGAVFELCERTDRQTDRQTNK